MRPKTDKEKLAIVKDFALSVHHSSMVCNGLRSGSEEAAYKRERKSCTKLVELLLGRKPTDDEIRAANI